MPTTKDLVTHYGASPTGGAADDAFDAFRADLPSLPDCILTIPNLQTYTFARGTALCAGATKVVIRPRLLDGTTATLSNSAGGFFVLGGGVGANSGDLWNNNTHSSRIASVAAGATSLQLLTPSEYTRYTAGRYILLTGIDSMGGGGSVPPNPSFMEYVLINSITSGGLISLATPTKYSYLSTWPNYDPGDAFSVDEGGPATIYVLNAGWHCDCEYDYLTFVNTGQAIYAKGQTQTFKNCICHDGDSFGPTASVNQTFTMSACDFSGCVMEVDKMVDTLVCDQGTIIDTLWFQSRAPDTLILDAAGTDGAPIYLNGTPRKTIVRNNSHLYQIGLGCTAFGGSDSVEVSDSTLTNGVKDAAYQNDESDYTASLGVVTITDTVATSAIKFGARWAVPNSYVRFRDSNTPGQNKTAFKVINVSRSGTNTLVQTDMADGFPHGPELSPHPCPNIKFTNVTGCADAVDLSQAAAYGRPWGEYTKRTYTATDFSRDVSIIDNAVVSWGTLVSVSITVSRAYTGSGVGTLTLRPLAQFSVPQIGGSTWQPTIDLKAASATPRIITPTTVSGSQGSDSLGSAPGAVWLTYKVQPFVSADITGEASGLWPIVTIEIVTNQGITFDTSPVTPVVTRNKGRQSHIYSPGNWSYRAH